MVLCNRRVQQPSQVWDLCTFEELTEWTANAPYRQRAQMFKTRFRSYLFGNGTPELPSGQHLEEELANPTVPATVLRGSILLAAMTECEDLPTDADYKIQVRQLTCVYDFGLHSTVQLVFYLRDPDTDLGNPYVQRSYRCFSYTRTGGPYDEPGWYCVV